MIGDRRVEEHFQQSFTRGGGGGGGYGLAIVKSAGAPNWPCYFVSTQPNFVRAQRQSDDQSQTVPFLQFVLSTITGTVCGESKSIRGGMLIREKNEKVITEDIKQK